MSDPIIDLMYDGNIYEVIAAADALAKAAKNARFYTETRNGIEDLELALAAYEKVRGVK